MDTALGARRQPLLWIITTAGDDDPEIVYAAENDYAVKVLEGTIARRQRVRLHLDHRQGRPLGRSRGVGEGQSEPRHLASSSTIWSGRRSKAAKSPSALVAFKRLRLNVRTSDSERAIDMAQWAKNSRGRFDPDKLDAQALLGRARPVEQDRHHARS